MQPRLIKTDQHSYQLADQLDYVWEESLQFASISSYIVPAFISVAQNQIRQLIGALCEHQRSHSTIIMRLIYCLYILVVKDIGFQIVCLFSEALELFFLVLLKETLMPSEHIRKDISFCCYCWSDFWRLMCFMCDGVLIYRVSELQRHFFCLCDPLVSQQEGPESQVISLSSTDDLPEPPLVQRIGKCVCACVCVTLQLSATQYW